ncbi:hypothetical protein GOC73_25660 [Sinorhizobium medicae]|nr:hypothetical protein [Sinorhizobium medicae]MDX1083763.1 hypothetical protein [Sinorhizobium medicae]
MKSMLRGNLLHFCYIDCYIRLKNNKSWNEMKFLKKAVPVELIVDYTLPIDVCAGIDFDMSTKFPMKTNKKIPYTVIRNGIYTFRIAVPKHLREKYGDQIWETLNTRDSGEAFEKVGPVRSKWRRQFESEAIPADALSYPVMQQTAASFVAPFTYAYAGDFLSASVADSIAMYDDRYSAVKPIRNPNSRQIAAAVGATETPALTFKAAFARFKQICPDKVLGKDSLETKRFWRRYEEAVEDFSEEMGDDVDCLKIDNATATEYRSKLVERLGEGEFKADAANKKMMWLKIILDEVFRIDHPGMHNPFKDLKNIKEDDAEKRPPFTEAEVKAVNAALETSGMSDEAKAIIRIGEYTGAGAKELAWLTASDIHLDAPIPYISIGKNALRKKVKTGGERHRKIPLVGDALQAMKQFPDGFTRFHHPRGPRQINRAMSEFFRRITPRKGHYSYRHRMADLLKNSNCDLGIQASIRGNKIKGHATYYGTEYSLQIKKEAIETALEYAKTRD